MPDPSHSAPLAPGAIARLLPGGSVTPPTRAALQQRVAWTAPGQPVAFTPDAFAVMAAVCERIVPQTGRAEPIPLAAMLDAAVADGPGNGWRYDAMPPDREAFVQGAAAIEAEAVAREGHPFVDLSPAQQDGVLAAIQSGAVQADGWAGLPPKRYFEELLALLCELTYSHPVAQAEIGYVGFADAHGFHAIGLNRRDPVEDEAYR